MKITLDTGVSGDWLKTGIDIRDGDRLKIMNPGQVIEGKFGEQYVFSVMNSKKKEGNLAFNRTSRNTLGRGFGTETEEWVGKVVKCFVVKQMVGDGLKNVLYLAPDGWMMSDDGEFDPLDESQAIDDAFDRHAEAKDVIDEDSTPF